MNADELRFDAELGGAAQLEAAVLDAKFVKLAEAANPCT